MKKDITNLLLKGALAFGVILTLLPIIIGVLASLRHGPETYVRLLLDEPEFWQAYKNSIVLCFFSVCGQLIVGIFTGWGLAQYNFPGKRWLILLSVIWILTPPQAVLLPQYEFAKAFGLLDSMWAVILPAVFSPIGILIFYSGFLRIPCEQLEAAEELGAKPIIILRKIALPQQKREIWAVILIAFAEQWNQLELPMACIQTKSRYPLSVYMATNAIMDRPLLLACCVLLLAPVGFLFVAGDKA